VFYLSYWHSTWTKYYQLGSCTKKAAQSPSPDVEVQDLDDIKTTNNQKQSTQDIDHFFSGVIMNEGKKSWKCQKCLWWACSPEVFVFLLITFLFLASNLCFLSMKVLPFTVIWNLATRSFQTFSFQIPACLTSESDIGLDSSGLALPFLPGVDALHSSWWGPLHVLPAFWLNCQVYINCPDHTRWFREGTWGSGAMLA